ncbi:MAG: hypothetical protein H6633_11780 [Anaerolineales bacterium]|nr:hypothetical protein [Anaerolineales bacterium]
MRQRCTVLPTHNGDRLPSYLISHSTISIDDRTGPYNATKKDPDQKPHPTAHQQMAVDSPQRNNELMLLKRASQVFISTHDLDQVLTSVLQDVQQELNVVACSAWLLDPEKMK